LNSPSVGEIVAATDVPCGYFDVIGATLEAFTAQLEGFDVFLAAVAS